jgi:histidyl-tRNA synthetase
VEEGWRPAESGKADAYVIALGEVGAAPLRIAEALRSDGISTEVSLTKRSLKAQFKSAERSGARVIVIVGESELSQGMVNVKDAVNSEQSAVAVNDISRKAKEILDL